MVLYHFNQSQPQPAPPVPGELVPLMKQLAKQVLKMRPDNINEFAAEFFEKLLIQRDGSLDKGYGKFRSYRAYCEFMQKMDDKQAEANAAALRRPRLTEYTDSGVASGASRSCPDNPASLAAADGKTQLDESVDQMEVCGVGIAASSRPTRNVAVKVRNAKSIPVHADNATVSFSEEAASSKPKVKPRKLSSKKPADDLIVIAEETSTDVADLMGGTAIQVIAARRIQKAFRAYAESRALQQRLESSDVLGGTAIQVIAARRIQKAYRQFKQRTLTEGSETAAHNILEGTAVQVIAASRIQRTFRAFKLRKVESAKIAEREMLCSSAIQIMAAKRIQREFRAYKLRKVQEKGSDIEREQEIIGYTADQVIAAGRIQKNFRAFSIRKALLSNQILAAQTIQRAIRKFLANVRARNVVVEEAAIELITPKTEEDVHVPGITEKSLAALLLQTKSNSLDEETAKMNALQIIDDLIKKEENDAEGSIGLEDSIVLHDLLENPDESVTLVVHERTIDKESIPKNEDNINVADTDSKPIDKFKEGNVVDCTKIVVMVSQHINEQSDQILENEKLSSDANSSEYYGQIEVTEEPCIERIVKRVIDEDKLDDKNENVDEIHKIEVNDKVNSDQTTENASTMEKCDDKTFIEINKYSNEKDDELPQIRIDENAIAPTDLIESDQINVELDATPDAEDSAPADLLDPTNNEQFLSIQDDFDLSEHSNTSTVIEVNIRETDPTDVAIMPHETPDESANDPFGHAIEPASSLTPTKPSYFTDRRHTIATIAEDVSEHLQELHDAAEPERAVLESLPEEIPYEPLLSSGEQSDSTVVTDDVTIESSTEESSSNSQPEDEGRVADAQEVDDIDLSSYGEDSLEAMYYSLRKNEIELDRMQSKKNAIKSKSVDCKAARGEAENISIAANDFGRSEDKRENITKVLSALNEGSLELGQNEPNNDNCDGTEIQNEQGISIKSIKDDIEPLEEHTTITESSVDSKDEYVLKVAQLVPTEIESTEPDNDKFASENQEMDKASNTTKDASSESLKAGIEVHISEKNAPMESDQQLTDSIITEKPIEVEESSLIPETEVIPTENSTKSESLDIITSTENPTDTNSIAGTQITEKSESVEVNIDMQSEKSDIQQSANNDIETVTAKPSTQQSLDLPTNPIEVAMQNHRQLLDRLHGSVTAADDDEFTSHPELRHNMWTSSVSEADSDYIAMDAPAQQRRLVKDDFNISTAYGHTAAAASTSSESSDTTQTATTIVSAVTRIQAGARGFLVRRRLRNSSGGTTSFADVAAAAVDAASGVGNSATAGASFGNAAIDESLEAMVEDNERHTLDGAARIIQRSYRRKQARNDRAPADIATTPGNALLRPVMEQSQDVSNGSDQDQDDDVGANTICVNISELPASALLSSSSSPPPQQFRSDVLEKLNIAANDAQNAATNQLLSIAGVGSDVGDVGGGGDHVGRRLDSEEAHQQRRLTLQRGDAVQRNSTPEEGAEAEEQVPVVLKDKEEEGEDTVDNGVDITEVAAPKPTSIIRPPPPPNTNTVRHPQRPQRPRRGVRQLGMVRQNSMPVQIDSDVLRMVPKHSAKRIRSAEEAASKKTTK